MGCNMMGCNMTECNITEYGHVITNNHIPVAGASIQNGGALINIQDQSINQSIRLLKPNCSLKEN